MLLLNTVLWLLDSVTVSRLMSRLAAIDVLPPPWFWTTAPTRFTSRPAFAFSVPPELVTYTPAMRSMLVWLNCPLPEEVVVPM